jgi:asparagine synthase (glutamine-hydrolysing)
MKHRGPDDKGEFFDEKNLVGLAHQRLSIIDLSKTGHQPMKDSSGKVTIAFNGEIYNYKELKELLINKGHYFKGSSDTEVLLYLYLEYGHGMLNKLNGIFAFSIWDKRTKELFVARDQLGVKPLYYSKTPKGFLFASELKSILLESSVSRELDYKAIYNHFTFLWSPGKRTLLKNVHKLEPGFALVVSNHQIVKHWRYYDLPYINKKDVNNYSEQDTIDLVKNKLIKAVQSQLVSDVPVGAFLSGGLDSSSIVALAKDQNPDLDLNCYTIKMNSREMGQDGFTDDLPYAQEVAKHLDVNLHTVDVDSSMILDLPKMLFHLDEPQADPAPLNVLMISELAKSHNIKVLLSGTGGDDFFTGYRRHYALQSERYWAFLPKKIRSALKFSSSLLPQNKTLFRRLTKAFEYADLADSQRISSYFSWLNPNVGINLFNNDIKSKINGFNPLSDLTHSLQNLPASCSQLDKMLYIEAKHFLADHNLNYTDKMGMSTGVEIRVPLLDIELIDLIVNIPDTMKQRGRTGKWIFKKAMEPYLPKNVIYRPKTGFGAPLRFWLKNQLKPIVEEFLSPQSLYKHGIFDPKEVRKMINLDRRGVCDYSYPIFSLLCIELWLKTFVDEDIPKIVSI